MKRRLISLLLVSVMVLFCFASCGEKTGEEIMKEIGEEASKDAVTISMYLMSEKPVSKEQEARMEAAVNEITETDFTIHVDLKYITADEYYAKLESDLAKMEEHYGKGDAGKTKDNPVYTDENGLPKVHYPKIEAYDVDIFYFGGYDRYVKYNSLGYLRNITEELSGSSKELKATINSNLINQFGVVNGNRYFAVPTNRALGEYTYLLVDKGVLDESKYSVNELTSLACAGCQDILDMVSTDAKYKDTFVPLYSATGELDVMGVKYFNASLAGLAQNKFSVLAGTYNSAWKNGAEGSYPVMDSIFNSVNNGNLSVEEQLKVLKGYEIKGYYGDEADAEKPFAVGYVKGSFDVIEKYGDDYEIIPVAAPRLDTADLYENLFAVANYTNSVSGSMEILTLLNTNEEFRNLILYGIEGENYTWVDSDVLDENGNPYRVVERQTKDPDKLYIMDPFKTGNTAIAYTASDEDPKAKGYIFDHNDGIVVDYVIGFSFYDGLKSKEITEESFNAFVELGKKTDAIYAEIVAAKTQEELDAALVKLKALADTEEYKAVMNATEDSKSPLAYYTEWLINEGLIYKEADPDDEIIVK